MISTTERQSGERQEGFSLVDLLIGLAVGLLLAAAVAPLWLSLQSVGSREGDRTIRALQGRVAVSRFERDLRLASADGCPFSAAGPVLEASASQVVFLERPVAGSRPVLIEWEVVKGSLMRRWGVCPEPRPSTYAHSRYSDNKTMLESLGAGSSLEYVINGRLVPAPVPSGDLASIEAVVLTLRLSDGASQATARMASGARVGR